MTRRVVQLAVIAAAGLLSGCQTPLRSELAGQWHGNVAIRTTRAAQPLMEDFSLTILPDGRFANLQLADTSRADRPGERIGEPGQPAFIVKDASFTPTTSRLAIRFADVRAEGGLILSGAAATARLLKDGRLEYHYFSYAVSTAEPERSEAIYQRAILQRVTPTTHSSDE